MIMMQKQFVAWFTLATIVIAACVPLVVTGCRNGKGPAERAGAQIDRAADRTGDTIEDAGKKINKALPGN